MSLQKYIIDTLDGDLSKTGFVKRMQFLLNIGKGYDDFSFINDLSLINNILDKYKNINTKWNILMHLVVASKADPTVVSDTARDYLAELAKTLKPTRVDSNKNNVMTERQSKVLPKGLSYYQNMLRDSIDELFNEYNISMTKANKISASSKKELIAKNKLYQFLKKMHYRIILALYLFQPALRSDYSEMQFAKDYKNLDEEINWIVINPKKNIIIMNRFKNVKNIGKQIINIRPELLNLLKFWVSALDGIGYNNEYLFHLNIIPSKREIRPVIRDESFGLTVSLAAKRILDTHLTINDFRHLWEIDIQRNPDYQKLTINQKEAFHKELLHSKNIAEFYNTV